MKKLVERSFSVFLITILIINGLIFLSPVEAKAAGGDKLPQVAIVSLDHYPFIEGDNNQFFVSAKNYSGQVQYQLFYTCKTTMGNNWKLINNDDMVDGWTRSVDAHEPIKVDITNLNLKSDYYRFAIRVRRVGVKGKYQNKYGDYDNALPFTFHVVKDADIKLNGDMVIDKKDFTQSEMLKIDGVDNAEDDAKYKLNLYDVKNNKWLINVTNYGDNINYDLKNIPEGTYIVDIWGKRNNSNNKYDGWKLEIINVKKEYLPQVAIVSLDHSPFVEGDSNKFFISSKNYSGQVQYQLFYTCKETMGNKWEVINNDDMVDGWTKSVDAHEPITVDMTNLNLKEGYYRFAIRVRRIGVKGKYQNKYGDYDNAIPFVRTVVKKADVYLNGDMSIEKTDFAKNDQLVINGVDGAASDTKYKLHLYDVKNNKWITNLTDYDTKIDYDLSNIPEGTYVVDIWGKKNGSSRKYDGWKLKVINITSEIKKITSAEDVNVSTSRNSNYKLPETVMATFEDGSSVRKSVIWNGTADTNKLGVYTFEGTVKGYNKKAKLTLTVEDVKGNTAGNIVNVAMVAKSNEWIYYTNHADEGKLYKIKANGESKTKVSDDAALYINVVDDWIYYCNLLDYGKLYKIRTDGTGRTKLCNDPVEEIIVENEWIYYANAAEDYKLYKIKNDGTSRTKLNNDYSANANLVNGFIYYTNCSDNYKIYRIKTDGTGRTALNNDKSGFLNVVDGWIYYENLSDSNKIYKIATNGTNRAKVSDQSGSFLNAADGWIYYTNLNNNNSLYKIKFDGTANQALNANGSFFIHVVDDYIYYENQSDSYNLYRIKNDGSENEKFDTGIAKIEDIQVTLDKNADYSLPTTVKAKMLDGSQHYVYIYWDTSEVDTSKVGIYIFQGTVKGYDKKIKMALNVIEIEQLEYSSVDKIVPKGAAYKLPSNIKANMSDGSTRTFAIKWTPSKVDTSVVGDYAFKGKIANYDESITYNLSVKQNDNVPTGVIVAKHEEWIYFQNIYDDNKVYRINKDGTGKTKLSDNEMKFIEIKDEWIYYQKTLSEGSYALYKMKTDGTNDTKLSYDKPGYVNIVDGWIYYKSDYDSKMYKISIDGTNKIELSADSGHYINVVDDWIYYSNNSDDGKLYKIKKDGTGKTRLNNEKSSYLTIIDNWIYYNNGKQICKIRRDGSNRTVIYSIENDRLMYEFKIVGDYIYFRETKRDSTLGINYNIWKIKLDSSEKMLLTSYIDNIMYIDGEWICYTRGYNNVYSLKIDGTLNTRLVKYSGRIISVIDGWVYYKNLSDNDMLYKVKTDGTENQLVY